MTEPAEIFANIFMLSDYQGHILLAKLSVGTWFCQIKEIYNGAKSVTGNKVSDDGFAG